LKINAKSHSRFKNIYRTNEMQVELEDGARVHDVLDLLCDSEEGRKSIFSHENKKLRHDVTVAKNGLFILYLDRLNTPVHKGDTLTLLYPACMG
jgi:molybdopterin converting factor small subunit